MDHDMVRTELQSVITQLDSVRRSLMADEPRRRTYLQAVKAQRDAQHLLAHLSEPPEVFRFAAE